MDVRMENSATNNVRQYFAKLALRGKQREALSRWATLPVETFFVAMRQPTSSLNGERRPCGREPQTLGLLFGSIRWD